VDRILPEVPYRQWVLTFLWELRFLVGTDPDFLSRLLDAFLKTLVRDEWMWLSDTVAPGAIPKHLANLRRNLQRLVLPTRRPERSYPGAVKIKMSNYRRKRPVVSVENEGATDLM
jgi:hypothetical protein